MSNVSQRVINKINELKALGKFVENYDEENFLCLNMRWPTTYMSGYTQFESGDSPFEAHATERPPVVVDEDTLIDILDTFTGFERYAMSEDLRYLSLPVDNRPIEYEPYSSPDQHETISITIPNKKDALLFKMKYNYLFFDWES